MSDDGSSMHTRPSLLVRIRDPRDAESWKLFVELYTPPVLRYCRVRGLQDADAADVAQEVMAQVTRSMQSFEYRPERGRFRDWLGTVMRHKVNRFLAKENLGSAGIGGDETAEALANLAAVESDAEWTAEFNAADSAGCPGSGAPALWSVNVAGVRKRMARQANRGRDRLGDGNHTASRLRRQGQGPQTPGSRSHRTGGRRTAGRSLSLSAACSSVSVTLGSTPAVPVIDHGLSHRGKLGGVLERIATGRGGRRGARRSMSRLP